jgi:hypothetical protein
MKGKPLKTIAEWIACRCFFCQTGKKHDHGFAAETSRVSNVLTKAESLNPADSIKVIACNLCGHKEEEK